MKPSTDTRDAELARLKREHADMAALLAEIDADNKLDGHLVHSDRCSTLTTSTGGCSCRNARIAALVAVVSRTMAR